MSSDSSESAEGLEEPLLPQDELSAPQDELSKLQPCANFLLSCKYETWYVGEIHKQISSDSNALKKFIQAHRNFTGEKYTRFISYKFRESINDILRTFCVTFRKERYSDYDNVGGFGNVYLVRVSLIEQEKDTPSVPPREDNKKASRDTPIDIELPIKCRGKESLIIQINSLRGGGVTLPLTVRDAKFSSITSGDTVDQIAVVRDMKELNQKNYPGGLEKFKNFFETHIKNHMKTLGKILVYHCGIDNSGNDNAASQGGATRRHKRLTRRRKSVFKRKGKKSYRKKKYGKTKKSRRFRRSVRSRR